MGDKPLDRDAQIAAVARQFVDFIEAQTGSAPPQPAEVEAGELPAAFGALDDSLNQLADLGHVYGTDRMDAIEPLVLPTAALMGEYMRHASDAAWIEPALDEDTTLIIQTADGVTVDLTGAVRVSLLSGMSNLKALANHLRPDDTPPETA